MSTRSRSRPPQLLVRRLSDAATKGYVQVGNLCVPCALGKSGITALKREGDGGTPRGRLAILEVRFVPKALRRFRSGLPMRRIKDADGWCDAPADRNYNRPVRHPYPASAEKLCRDDDLYDIVVVLDHNIVPRARNRGSAIFMHVARDGFQPTEGCIALRRRDLIRILSKLRRGATVVTACM